MMAQSRRSCAHVSGRAEALARSAPARAGEAWAPSSDHTTPAGNPVRSLMPAHLGGGVEVSAPACLLGGEAAPARPAVARAGPGGKAM
ncbi:MAG TPA: hypothetical protein VGF54_09460 [Streptosporangiaceae bacterium]